MIFLFLLIAASGFAAEFVPTIRAVSIKANQTAEQLAAIDFQTVADAWKDNQVDLRVERKLEVRSIEPAREVIRRLYERAGHDVRVEHTVTQARPGGVEIVFQVIQLCRCR